MKPFQIISLLIIQNFILLNIIKSQGLIQNVTFESPDGYSLQARLYPAAEHGPGVLTIHQCDRENDSTGYETLAPLLQANGLHVLDIDLRGYGTNKDATRNVSSGNFPMDVSLALQFLIEQDKVNPKQVVVIGASCGASQAIFLAKDKAEIMSMVFISGSFWKGAPEAYESLIHIPLLAITSEDDRVANRMMDAFAKSKSPKSKLIVYKGVLHGTPLFNLDPQLIHLISDWINTTLE